jgi:predicted transcriptional regulator
LSQVLERVYHGCQDDFPVVGDEGLVGILTRNRILAAVHEKGVDIPASEAMDREYETVDPRSPLEQVYRRLAASSKTAAAVVEGGQLRGLVCEESIGRQLAIRAALRGMPNAPAAAPAATA